MPPTPVGRQRRPVASLAVRWRRRARAALDQLTKAWAVSALADGARHRPRRIAAAPPDVQRPAPPSASATGVARPDLAAGPRGRGGAARHRVGAPAARRGAVALGLVVGGALGNLIDRACPRGRRVPRGRRRRLHRPPVVAGVQRGRLGDRGRGAAAVRRAVARCPSRRARRRSDRPPIPDDARRRPRGARRRAARPGRRPARRVSAAPRRPPWSTPATSRVDGRRGHRAVAPGGRGRRRRGRRPRRTPWPRELAPDAVGARAGRPRGRRRDRRRQAGRPGRAPRGRAATRAPWCNGLLARYPEIARRRRARPARASSTASTRARRAAGRGPQPARLRRRWSASWRPATVDRRYLALVWGRARSRRPGWSTPRSAARRREPTRMAVAARGKRGPHPLRGGRGRSRDPVEVTELDVPPRDRAHPPDPGAPARPIGHPRRRRRPLRRRAPVAAVAPAVPARRAAGLRPPGHRRGRWRSTRRCPPTSPSVLAALSRRCSAPSGQLERPSRRFAAVSRGRRARAALAAWPWRRCRPACSSSRRRRMWSPTSAQIGQQHALALVVAGAVLVRLAEVADDDRAVDRARRSRRG